jgi:two-component system, NarL family, nitrate/nitrite response regulator NarL
MGHMLFYGTFRPCFFSKLPSAGDITETNGASAKGLILAGSIKRYGESRFGYETKFRILIMARPFSVAICLRNQLLRDGISLILKEANYRILASTADIDELKSSKLKTDGKFILLVGEQLDRTFDRSSIIELKERYPQSLIVLLLDSCPAGRRWEVERLGVAAVLLKSISGEALVACLRLVELGEYVFGVPIAFDASDMPSGPVERLDKPNHQVSILPECQSEPIRYRPDDTFLDQNRDDSRRGRRSKLSERELEILACLVSGSSNKLIARRCNITEATVKVHLKTILRKVDVGNRTQAAVWAINNIALNGTVHHTRLDIDRQAQIEA